MESAVCFVPRRVRWRDDFLPQATTLPERMSLHGQKALLEFIYLYELSGIQWSRHRLRLGETRSARQLTIANRAICKRMAGTIIWPGAIFFSENSI